MGWKQLHWLEIAELVALGMAAIAIALAFNVPNGLPVTLLILAVSLNVANRFRAQYLSRKRLLKEIDKLHQKLNVQIQQLAASPSNPSKDSPTSAPLRDTLVSVEQALNNVVAYLNTHVLPERVEQLEKAYHQLTKELRYLSEHLNDPSREPLLVEPAATADAAKPPTQLPSVVSTLSVSPVPAVPLWESAYQFNEHADAVASLAISPDGQWLASASWDRTLRLWELATGTLKTTVTAHSQGVLAVVFTSGGEQLATGSFDQTIKIWHRKIDEQNHWTLERLETLTAHTGSVQTLVLSGNPLLLVSGSYDQTVKQWKLPAGELQCSSYDSSGTIYAIALCSTAKAIASAGGDGRVTLWELETGKPIGFLAGNVSSVESLAISADGQTLAAGCVDGTIKLWQLDPTRFQAGRPLQPIRTLNAHNGQVRALIFSHDTQIIVSGGADGYIKFWHPTRREAIATLTLSEPGEPRLSAIMSLTLSPDGHYLVAGGADGTIKTWRREE